MMHRQPNPILADSGKAIVNPAGADYFGETRSHGVGSIAFKSPAQGADSPLIVETTFRAAGGPARHLHYAQDEWIDVCENK